MKKISIIGLPFPIASVIIGYNLGNITPAIAQESSLFIDLNLVRDRDISSLDSLPNISLPNYKNNPHLFSKIDAVDISKVTNYTWQDDGIESNFQLQYSLDFNSLKDDYDLNEIENKSFINKKNAVFSIPKNLEHSLINYNELLPFTNLQTIQKSKPKLLNIDRQPPIVLNKEFVHNSSGGRINSKITSESAESSLPKRSKYSDRIQDKIKKTESLPESNSHTLITEIKNNNNPLTIDTFQVTNSESGFTSNQFTASITEKESNLDKDDLKKTLNQIEEYDRQNIALEPFTKVSDLKDVTKSDWAYDALLKLVNRYRCLTGFEDNTFRGNKTLTRYEFAAALNSCLEKIETLATENTVIETELTQLQRLTSEFESELLKVQSETDNLEQKIAVLEEQNFSPTTILRGQVVFQMASAFGDKKAVPSGETPSEDLDTVPTFGARARLNFETSFTGRDLLRTRIEAGNVNGYGSGVTGTDMTFLGVATNTGNNVRLGQIFYRFPLGDKGNAYVAGARQSASAFIPTLNRASTISLLGFNNPLYDLGFGAGGGVYYQFTDTIGAGLTYYSGSPNNPESGKGLFNGDYSALGQITFTPGDNLGISLTYAHFFSPEPGSTNNVTSFTGSQFAQLPFGSDTATASDNFNLSLSYQISDRIEVGGWLGYLKATAQSSPTDSGFTGSKGAKADIWNWALTASYSDLGKLGSKLSLILGMPPKLTDNEITNREDEDTSLHVELSYNYPLTEKISLKPGILAITNPEHNSNNDTILVGLLQTTFNF